MIAIYGAYYACRGNMSNNNHRIPAYGKHRATGQARVVLNGRSIYLGPYGSKESREAYQRIINEWIQGDVRFQFKT